ncbi:MAG: hypothetical protein RLZZ470_501 [Pseudomonadota bacterium]|jgi:uncharacterized protein (TIGR03084 family)
MQAICQDLLDEYQALAGLCDSLTPAQWQSSTHFYQWTPWDEIAHLCYFDETGLQAATDPEGFNQAALPLAQRLYAGEQISAIARECYAHLDGAALLAHWRGLHQALVTALLPLDAKDRLPWYGPPMSARSFASARLMETWAHGQDIWDLVKRQRPATSRLKHIAHLGVTTFKWTFMNRQLPVPEVQPHVVLQAPDGDTWTWNPASDTHVVQGRAEDFCLLVTQRRHLDDTALYFQGEGVQDWLRLAQCFAGPPADGPLAGVRV